MVGHLDWAVASSPEAGWNVTWWGSAASTGGHTATQGYQQPGWAECEEAVVSVPTLPDPPGGLGQTLDARAQVLEPEPHPDSAGVAMTAAKDSVVQVVVQVQPPTPRELEGQRPPCGTGGR